MYCFKGVKNARFRTFYQMLSSHSLKLGLCATNVTRITSWSEELYYYDCDLIEMKHVNEKIIMMSYFCMRLVITVGNSNRTRYQPSL